MAAAPIRTTADASRQRRMRWEGVRVSALGDTGGLCLGQFGCSDVAAQLRPQLFGDEVRIRAIANDLRSNEDDQLGAGCGIVLMSKRITEDWNLIEPGNGIAGAGLLLADQ